jgi:hypothetical protein
LQVGLGNSEQGLSGLPRVFGFCSVCGIDDFGAGFSFIKSTHTFFSESYVQRLDGSWCLERTLQVSFFKSQQAFNGLPRLVVSLFASGLDELAFGIASGLDELAFGIASGLDVLAFGVGTGLDVLAFGVGTGLDELAFGVGTGLDVLAFGVGTGLDVLAFGVGTGLDELAFGVGTGLDVLAFGVGVLSFR